MNIFLSFSGVARDEFAIKFLNFFNKFGFHCWYDQHELFLGNDLKNTIIQKGINTADYCILIINQTYLNKTWPCEEAKKLYNKLKLKDYNAIFPILLDISKEELETSQLSFILNIKYQFLHTGEDIAPIGLQIFNSIMQDIVLQNKFKTIGMAEEYFHRLTFSDSIDVFNVIQTINYFNETDYKNRTIILICLIKLLNKGMYEKAVTNISYMIYDNKSISFDIYKIIESIFLINASLFAT